MCFSVTVKVDKLCARCFRYYMTFPFNRDWNAVRETGSTSQDSLQHMLRFELNHRPPPPDSSFQGQAPSDRDTGTLEDVPSICSLKYQFCPLSTPVHARPGQRSEGLGAKGLQSKMPAWQLECRMSIKCEFQINHKSFFV